MSKKSFGKLITCVFSMSLLFSGVVSGGNGPYAPEYISFEPLSARDLVDPSSGKFVYNTPILTVPGPRGGYSMSLSYHSGIELEEEASWVGLGWTLNPGAINRTVNLFPDDFGGSLNNTHTYWEGGLTNIKTVTPLFTLGIVNFDIYSDTYSGSRWTDASTIFGKRRAFDNSNSGGGESDPMITQTSGSHGIKSFTDVLLTATGSVVKNRWTRYFIYHDQFTSTYGSLYPLTQGTPTDEDSYDRDFDSYNLLDPSKLDQLNARNYGGGILPAHDSYQVLAEGIGGVIQPRYLQNTYLYKKDFKGDIEYYKNEEQENLGLKGVNFYYVGEYSNSFAHQDKNISDFTNSNNLKSESFRRNQWTDYNSDLYNQNTNHLATAKTVKWYTNEDLVKGTGSQAYKEGFIAHDVTDPINSGRLHLFGDFSVHEQIGGFMITNEAGVTYHFSQPVYTYDEYSKTNNLTNKVEQYKLFSKYSAYAYTWLLTAITGPDYVDKGVAGISDDDLGYWVEFNYGLWTDRFKWRTPNQGNQRDLDRTFDYFGRGKNERYYLNYIRTKSHTALFIKDLRNDGKSISDFYVNTRKRPVADNTTEVITTYSSDDIIASKLDEITRSNHSGGSKDESYIRVSSNGTNYTANGACKAISTLKLNEILLVRNSALKEVLDQHGIDSPKALSNNNTGDWAHHHSRQVAWSPSSNAPNIANYIPYYKYHFTENVLDVNDIETLKQDLYDISVQNTEFVTDYSLCDNTPNSYSNDRLYSNYEYLNRELTGKLTLKEVKVKGVGGNSLIPSTKFFYDKNASYQEDYSDLWGYYKSDFDSEIYETNEDVSKQTTYTSAQQTDVWSLTRIQTPLGASYEVEYEPNTYTQAIYPAQNYFMIESISKYDETTTSKIKIRLRENYTRAELQSYLQNKTFSFSSLLRNDACSDIFDCLSPTYASGLQANIQQLQNEKKWYVFKKQYSSAQFENAKEIIINDAALFSLLFDQPNFVSNGLVTASILFDKPATKYASGSRVKSITLDKEDKKNSINYTYEGGYTTYEPDGIDIYLLDDDEDNEEEKDFIELYKNKLYGNRIELFALASEMPGAGVTYEKVKKQESIFDKRTSNLVQVPITTELTFQKFQKDFVKYETEELESTLDGTPTKFKKIKLKNYSSRTGSVLSEKVYGIGNQLISETTNEYFHDNATNYDDLINNDFSNLGKYDQVSLERRKAQIGGEWEEQLNIFHKETYPTFARKQISKNYVYKTEEESENLSFDLLTGSPNAVVSTDMYGNKFVEEYTRAYQIPAYSMMLPKSLDMENNLNQITSLAKKEVYQINPSDYSQNIALVSASASTYAQNVPSQDVSSNGNPFWVNDASYYYLGDANSVNKNGYFDVSTYDSNPITFTTNYNQSFSNSRWKLDSKATLLNKNSQLLESKDGDNDYSAARMSPNDEYVIINASNCKYDEIAFSGAEFYDGYSIEGGVNKKDGLVSTAHYHSGISSIKLKSGRESMEYRVNTSKLTPGRSYIASVWAYLPNIEQADFDKLELYYEYGGVKREAHPIETDKAGAWYLLKLTIPSVASGVDLKIACKNNHPSEAIYIDDFRFQPLNTSATSYVYDQKLGRLTHLLDSDNLYTRYVYDIHGRLQEVYQEIFYTVEKRVSRQEYNYSTTHSNE